MRGQPSPSPLIPSPSPSPRLTVLPAAKQDCVACPHLDRCWSARGKKALSESAVVTNLLVCRVQLGIERDRSMRLLLSLLRPKIMKTAYYVAEKTGTDVEEARMDIESVVAVSVMRYKMGADAPPVVWLFNSRYGSVRHWVLQTLERTQRERALLHSYDYTDADIEERLRSLNQSVTNHRIRSWSWATPPEPEAPSDHHLRALEAVDDGRTLNTTEYRVLKFCLRHAHGTGRLTDHLHQYLSDVMGVSRKDTSRYYGLAWRKLLDAVGMRAQYFRARGHVLRRRPGTPLTAADICEGLSLLDRFTTLDVAWMLDVNYTTVHALRRRYGGLSEEEVHDRMTRRRGAHVE